MKVSDYIVKFLESQKIKYVFGITGGAIAHIFDSIGKNPEVKYVCNQHEQASAMAADAYARVTEDIGVALATSGPGATNLITGICCSYYDSIPCLFITGQVSTSKSSKGKNIRQLGFQETDIVEMVKPVTKYACILTDIKMLRYELEKAIYFAKSRRPGPVLVDIPDDLQRAEINPEDLPSFIYQEEKTDKEKIKEQVKKTIELINNSKRPVIVLGFGIRLDKAIDKINALIEKLQIPVLVTWAGKDLISENNPLYVGTFGITGSRYGNFTIQNSDLILSIGSRLDSHATGMQKDFAKKAKKIVVDIDKEELEKFREMNVDIKIQSRVEDFVNIFEEKIKDIKLNDFSKWKKRIEFWKTKYPLCKKEYYSQENNVNAYVFFKEISKRLKENDIIIADTGESLTQVMNTLEIKKGQRLFSAFNNTPMGYSLPATIGASFANPDSKIVGIAGDGGLQMNIQELVTIKKHNLPVKIFVFNNKGYNMIKETQNQWLDSNYEASCEEKGLAFPNFNSISEAYGIKSNTISKNTEIKEKLDEVFFTDGPFLCNVEINPQPFFMTLRYGRPLEDLSPCLDKKELMKNMNF